MNVRQNPNKMPKDEENQALLDKENGKTDYSADGESDGEK